MKQTIWKTAKSNKALITDVFSFNLLNKYNKGAETPTSPDSGGQVLYPPAVLPLFKCTTTAEMAALLLNPMKASPADTERPETSSPRNTSGRSPYIISPTNLKTNFKTRIDWKAAQARLSISGGVLERCQL